MGDPVGALRHVRETIADDGTCMLVEPFANDRLENNFTPVGRLFYAASTMVCTPASMAQEVGLARRPAKRGFAPWQRKAVLHDTAARRRRRLI
jgi:hypothetical protein